MLICINYEDDKFYKIDFEEQEFNAIELKNYKCVEDILEDLFTYLYKIDIKKIDIKKIKISCCQIIEEVHDADITMLFKLFDMRDYDYEAERKMFGLFYHFNYEHIFDTFYDIYKIELNINKFNENNRTYEILDIEHGCYLFQIK